MYSLSHLTSANFQFSDSRRARALCVAEQDHQGWAVLALFYLDNLGYLDIRALRNIVTKGCPTDESDAVEWTLDGSYD